MEHIQYYPLFGGLWFAILGVIVLLMFIATAVIPSVMKKGKLSLKWHVTMAMISIILLLAHVVLGMLAYFA
ncbi:hypothetical protein JW707_04575 [Candidatus Woesearchaeota archaeon]|nr:hypothetical protein [Candidatus Woesearchaeota archaeon]